MQLNFTYTYQTESGNEIELAVTAKYYRGYAETREQPAEPEEIEIIAVVGPDGFVYDDNDLLEDWPLIEAKARGKLEIEKSRYDNSAAEREERLAESMESRISYDRF